MKISCFIVIHLTTALSTVFSLYNVSVIVFLCFDESGCSKSSVCNFLLICIPFLLIASSESISKRQRIIPRRPDSRNFAISIGIFTAGRLLLLTFAAGVGPFCSGNVSVFV
jgi:hypothetical protein